MEFFFLNYSKAESKSENIYYKSVKKKKRSMFVVPKPFRIK